MPAALAWERWRRRKVGQTTGQQSSGLGRKGLCDTLGVTLGTGTGVTDEEEVLHPQAFGDPGEKKIFP